MKVHKLAVLLGVKSVEQIGLGGNNFSIEFYENQNSKLKFNQLFKQFFPDAKAPSFEENEYKGEYKMPNNTLDQTQQDFLNECEERIGVRNRAQQITKKKPWSPATFSPNKKTRVVEPLVEQCALKF